MRSHSRAVFVSLRLVQAPDAEMQSAVSFAPAKLRWRCDTEGLFEGLLNIPLQQVEPVNGLPGFGQRHIGQWVKGCCDLFTSFLLTPFL